MQLIVRECYPRIFELSQRLAKQRRGGGGGVVFSGNPGIGKSWFLNYTLWRLLQQKKTVLVESVAREKVWLFKEGQVQEASLENTKQIVELFQTVENDTDAWYLFDPCGDIPREPKQMLPFTVVAASPNPQHYKQFYKRTRNKYYTPCWPWEELKKLCVKQPKRWPQVLPWMRGMTTSRFSAAFPVTSIERANKPRAQKRNWMARFNSWICAPSPWS